MAAEQVELTVIGSFLLYGLKAYTWRLHRTKAPQCTKILSGILHSPHFGFIQNVLATVDLLECWMWNILAELKQPILNYSAKDAIAHYNISRTSHRHSINENNRQHYSS